MMKSIIYLFSIFLLLSGLPIEATAQLNEGFEGTFPPNGWVVLDNGVQTNQSWGKSSKNANNGSSHAYVAFSSSTTELAEDWLITPKVKPDASNKTLTFHATNDFNGNTNSIYTIRVSTTSQSDRSSFTTVATYAEADFTAKTYKSFNVDLSAYEDQEIYIAFVLENSRGDSYLLDDVSGLPLVSFGEVPMCDVMLSQPPSTAWNVVPVDITLAWTPASGGPTGYKIQIGTSQGGSEFLALTDVGNTTSYKPMNNLANDTRYYVKVTPYNRNGDAADCQEYEFVTESSTSANLDCTTNNSSVSRSVCYGNNATESFSLSANDGKQVNLTFNAGTVENNQDEIYIYDGTDASGRLLNAGKLYGNNGDLNNLSYTSTTSNLFVQITSDASNSCSTGEQTPINYTASCVDCVPPIATVAKGNCDGNNNQFYLELNITNKGSSDLVLTNDQNVQTQDITSTGIIQVGPFNYGTVQLSLRSENNFCSIELPAVTVESCPPANEDCANAMSIMLSDNNCSNIVKGVVGTASISDNVGACSNNQNDVWYAFTADSTTNHIFEFTNRGITQSMSLYSGSCGENLSTVGECESDSLISANLVDGQTYLIRISSTDSLALDTFSFCAKLAPPTNDLCTDAQLLACPAGIDSMNIDATNATATGAMACNSNAVGAGVWYRLIGTGSRLAITATPQNWNAEIQIFSGADCNNLTCQTSADAAGNNAAETISNFQTTANTTYYIYIGANETSGSAGLFNLSITCIENTSNIICLDNPTNDPCNNIQINEGTVNQNVTACQTINTAESAVTIENSQTVEFKAGTSITLKAGFTVQKGALFTAKIEACSSNLKSEEEQETSTKPTKQ